MDATSDEGRTGGRPPRADLTIAGAQAGDAVHNRPVRCAVHRGDEGSLLSDGWDAVGDVVHGITSVSIVRVVTHGNGRSTCGPDRRHGVVVHRRIAHAVCTGKLVDHLIGRQVPDDDASADRPETNVQFCTRAGQSGRSSVGPEVLPIDDHVRRDPVRVHADDLGSTRQLEEGRPDHAVARLDADRIGVREIAAV